MGEFFEQLQKVWPLVVSAPWGFAPLFALILFAGWIAGRFTFSERIANLKSRLEIRDETIAALERSNQVTKPASTIPGPLASSVPKPVQQLSDFGSIDQPISLRKILVGKRWTLHFNPGGDRGRKQITFLPDGTIGDGRNNNEYSWGIEGVATELLAIYRADKSVQNIFQYSDKTGKFNYLADSRSRGLRDQFIEPA